MEASFSLSSVVLDCQQGNNGLLMESDNMSRKVCVLILEGGAVAQLRLKGPPPVVQIHLPSRVLTGVPRCFRFKKESYHI
jgi:hypothetical protein